MRPSHRKDILAHALVYYGIRTKKARFVYLSLFLFSIAISLCSSAHLMYRRWEKAHHTKAIVEETFSNLMPDIECKEIIHILALLKYKYIRDCLRRSSEVLAFRRRNYL